LHQPDHAERLDRALLSMAQSPEPADLDALERHLKTGEPLKTTGQ